jgi:hypothetical protein
MKAWWPTVAGLVGSAAALALVSCGSGNSMPSSYTCSSLPNSCTEFAMLSDTSTPTVQMAQTYCSQGGGTWSSGSCPTASRVGGCEIVQNEVTWYYLATNQTTAQVMNSCTSAGGTFFPP